MAIDPNLGVPGLPQSATGQSALLTGINVPAAIGEHYGPKPNQPVRDQLAKGTLFSQLTARGYRAALLNAYPDGYFSGVNSGKRSVFCDSAGGDQCWFNAQNQYGF